MPYYLSAAQAFIFVAVSVSPTFTFTFTFASAFAVVLLCRGILIHIFLHTRTHIWVKATFADYKQ